VHDVCAFVRLRVLKCPWQVIDAMDVARQAWTAWYAASRRRTGTIRGLGHRAHDEVHRNVIMLFLVILPATQYNRHTVVGLGRTRSQSQPQEL
jgi:hypothetical protein